MAEIVAEAFLSSFIEVAFEKLASNSDLFKFFRSRKLKEGLLKNLKNILYSVNQVIEDAEERQYSNQNVKKWLDDLKDEVFKAADLLDEIATEKLAAESQSKVRRFLTSSVSLFDKTIESRLQEVLVNLEDLMNQNEILGLKAGLGGSSQVGGIDKLVKREPTSILVDESSIYGRDGDKESIIDMLSSHSGSEPVNVIAITAMGGMGKTTLARLVYEDQRMKDLFKLKVWWTVSEEFDVSLITKGILQKLGGSTEGSVDDLQLKLKEKLTGKKFLLVLDDVWSQNRRQWEFLQAPFRYGATGSKIIVTTRSEKVAEILHSTNVHHLKQLEDDDSWRLFERNAFTDEQRNNTDPNLVLVGGEIVRKCGGLPLAIKTLASLLYNKKSLHDWNEILKSEIWELSKDDSDIIPSLRLSYHYLSSNPKLCFAYCSIFPKDYEIEKDVLIQWWMAEGLLDSNKKGKKTMTEVGNEIFYDLKSRSFFEPSKSNEKYFVMHDLVNDLAKSVIGEFYLGFEGGRDQDVSPKARYFSYLISEANKVKEFEDISKCHQLRSFVSLGPLCYVDQDKVLANFLSRPTQFKYLRVLSLSGYSITGKLTNNVGNLKHLRYLDLSYSEIIELPSSICLMINLQTLKLKSCKLLSKLPSDFTKLINLCHLDLEDSGLEKMPKYMGKLNQLETMNKFVVGEKKGYDLKELGALKRIRGRLVISKLENVIDPTTATEAKMKDKHLDKLELSWERLGVAEQEHQERILEALQPNCEIKKLVVKDYGGRIFPNWFCDGVCLLNVVSLKLSCCIYCTRLPPLGQLPLLKKLEISEFEGLKVIGEEFYGNGSSSCGPFFRSLTYLSFSGMAEWEEWNNNVGGEEEGESSFPCLEVLHIFRCPKLRKSLPQYLPSLKELWLSKCNNLESSVRKASRRRLRDESAEMESLPHQHHPLHSSLRSLRITDCPKLMASRMDWDLHHHLSLEEIIIDDSMR